MPDVAYDVILAQRKDDNSRNIQRNVPGTPNTVIGFDALGHPTSFPYVPATATLTILGTANEITASTVASTVTLSLPAALTFTGKTVTGGRFVLPASTTAGDFLVLPHGVAPTTPTDGALWSTTAGFFGRVNGTTIGPFGIAGSGGSGSVNAGTTNQLAYYASNGTAVSGLTSGNSMVPNTSATGVLTMTAQPEVIGAAYGGFSAKALGTTAHGYFGAENDTGVQGAMLVGGSAYAWSNMRTKVNITSVGGNLNLITDWNVT